MTTDLATELQSQLSLARKEIKSLRKQVNALTNTHQTDLKVVKNLLADFKCTGCREQQKIANDCEKQANLVKFKPIGWIHTDFPEKRAVPRQPNICSKLTGYIEISKDVFNNPEHSLEKLDDFSHLWIIYHFHKNDSHAKAKVAPPRLCGERCGIFSTRSPHRPCPIGLSLVEIDRIDGRLIYFRGTDMVDMTPVLDLKPYIPRYDSPTRGCLTDNQSVSIDDENQHNDRREEPDGEETAAINSKLTMQQSSSSSSSSSTSSPSSSNSTPSSMASYSTTVRVPNWIQCDSTLEVVFNERASAQICEYEINKANIVDVLKNDPRSVYLKTRYGSQIFTFQLGQVTVTCKFDDANGIVTVVQVRKTENLSNDLNPDTNAN